MFNSANNKIQNNHILEKSTLFDFSKQGFSPILIKSKFSFYDQEFKEGNLYQNEHFANKDSLRNSLFKEKLPINSVNKKSSPFNLNFMERRNSLTMKRIPQTKKIMSIDKNFECFNPNLNLHTNNFDKNYLFDSNLGRNYNSNYMTTNELTVSNSNLFKTFKNKSNEKANAIKYADDYSFKKENIYSEVVNLIEDNVEDDTEQQKKAEIEKPHRENFNFRRSSRLNGTEDEAGLLLMSQKIVSSTIKKKNLKKFKKLNKTKIKKNMKNKNNNSSNDSKDYNINKISDGEKEQKCKLDVLQKAADSVPITNYKEDNNIKGFSFLKQKRKAQISSSLFGCPSLSIPNKKENLIIKRNQNIEVKSTKKSSNKAVEEHFDSIDSIPSSGKSESEYVCSIKNNKTKHQREPNHKVKTGPQLEKETKELLYENTKFKVERDLKGTIVEKSGVLNSFKTNNDLKIDKKIHFSVSKSQKNLEIDDYTSSAFSFGFEETENEIKDDKSFCNIMKFQDSVGNFPAKNTRIAMEIFGEIFGKKILKLNRNKKSQSLNNLMHFVDSKTFNINRPQNNEINFASKEITASKFATGIKANINENNKSANIFSFDNFNKNLQNFSDTFEDDESMKKFSSYRNNKIKDLMIEYIVWGKPNIKKLGFGDCPLNVYADFFMRGKEVYSNYVSKLDDKAYLNSNFRGKNPKRDFLKFTLKKLNEIALSMNEISSRLSKYSIFNFGLDSISKHKTKEMQSENTEIVQSIRPTKKSRTNITEKVLAGLNAKKSTPSNDSNNTNNFKKRLKNQNLIDQANNNTAKKNNKSYIDDDKDSSYKEDSDDLDSEIYSNTKKKSEKDPNEITEGYNCELCGQIFSNGQGLGGHMSRKHPNQSEKYKNKKETRERRNAKREILYKAQKFLLLKYKQDYERLKQTSEGRKLIKKICKDHKSQYYQIKREIVISRNNNTRRKTKS